MTEVTYNGKAAERSAEHKKLFAVPSPFQQQQDSVGSAGIESCRWLIQKQDGRIRDELHPNTGPFPLSPRHSTSELGADLPRTEKRVSFCLITDARVNSTL